MMWICLSQDVIEFVDGQQLEDGMVKLQMVS